jgi:carbonic anhydrase
MTKMTPLLERNEQFAGFLADPTFRQHAAAATGLSEAALEASAVTDPHTTVKADVERLLTAPSLSPKVSVSGHVYDIATGRVTTTVEARYPSSPVND